MSQVGRRGVYEMTWRNVFIVNLDTVYVCMHVQIHCKTLQPIIFLCCTVNCTYLNLFPFRNFALIVDTVICTVICAAKYHPI